MDINITNEDISKLERKSPFTINCNEGSIYIIKKNGKFKALKLFNITNNDNNLSLNTLKYLIKNKPYISNNNLVLPDNLLYVNNTFSGFSMDFIKGINLTNYLKKDTITISDKIKALSSLGKILETLKNNTPNIHIGDLHLANIIVDRTNTLKVIDPNGFYIDNFIPRNSKYLVYSNLINNLNKYKKTKDNTYIPSYQTDLYCYIIIILSYISSFPTIFKLDLKSIIDYFNYLKNIGFDNKLLNILSKIYKNEENINPYELLDNIKNYDLKDLSYENLKKTL